MNSARLYTLSFLAAAVLMLPQYAQWRDVEMPLLGLLSVPATGLSYMAVFFHEIGHCLTGWIFGYPGVPMFDAQHGGGLTLHGDRNNLVLIAVYAGMAAIGWRLGRAQAWSWLAAFSVLAVLHGLAAFTSGHESVMNYMGQGAEIALGCFCLWRGFAGHDAYGAAEKWLNMILGWFLIMNAGFLDYTLMTDPVMREVYEAQKGTHGFGDFSRIAEAAGIRLEAAAGIALAPCLLLAASAVIAGLLSRKPA